MANYYDRVLEGFDEGILDDSYDEGIFDDSYDEGILDESKRNDRRRPQPKFPSSVGKASNFGRGITNASSSSQGNYATKAELKSSLNSISSQVNDLKKSSLTIASSIKRLDDGYEKVVRSIAKKDKAQDSVIGSSTMMTLLGTIINRPTFDPSTLQVVQTNSDDVTKGAALAVPQTIAPEYKIQLDAKSTDPINIDLTKTLLFTMMPMMMAGSGGSGTDNNMMTMMMMVLLLGTGGLGGNATSGSGISGGDNTIVLVMAMMLMNKK